MTQEITIEFLEGLRTGCKCNNYDCYDCFQDGQIEDELEKMKFKVYSSEFLRET